MAGPPSLAAHMWRLVAVAAIFAFVAVVLMFRGWPNPRPASAAGDTVSFPDLGSGGTSSSLALDSAGNPVVSYQSFNDVRVVHCGDPACSAGNTIAIVETAVGLVNNTTLKIGPDAAPVVVYATSSLQLHVVHCGNPNCTGSNALTTPDVVLSKSPRTSMALDTAGHPVISYTNANAQLTVLHCGNSSCTSGNVFSTPAALNFTVDRSSSIVMDAAGNPVVAYHDITYNKLNVLRCGNPTCTAGNTFAALDTLGYGYGQDNTWLVLDTAGRPAITYHDTVYPYGLKLLRCGNLACTSGNSTTRPDIYPSSSPFGPLPIVLDGSGNPVIGYNGPQVLHCGNADCTSGNSYGDIEAAYPGSAPSLELDASGYPVVASSSSSGLAVYHCGSATCKALFLTPTPTETATGTPQPTATPVRPPDFSIGIDTTADGTDDCRTIGSGPTKCSLAIGSTFTLHTYLQSYGGLPGYSGFDLLVTYGGVLSLNDASTAPWPDCGFSGQFYNVHYVRWGCVTGIASPHSLYTGLIATLDFTCAASGAISLTHGVGQTDIEVDGTSYAESGAEVLTVNCIAPTPHPMPLGGVAEYPRRSGGAGLVQMVTIAAAIVAAILGNAAWYAGRRL